MFLTPKKFGQGAVGTGAGTLVYTVPKGVTGIVKCVDVCNTSALAATVSLYLVPSGATATAANALFYALNIAANSAYQWTGTQCMTPDSFIQAIGSGTGLTVNISGGEYVA